jgi:Cytochrome P450/Thrombospondin type 3 repeat
VRLPKTQLVSALCGLVRPRATRRARSTCAAGAPPSPTRPDVRRRRHPGREPTFYALVDDLIARRRSARLGGEDLLSRLLDARDPETGTAMEIQQVRDEALIFLLAGHETTSSALTFTLQLLGRHPDEQQRVADELADVLCGRPPTVHDLPALRRTAMVLKQAMRLYPPVYALARRAEHEDEIGDHRIPRGSLLVVSQWATHRHLRSWKDSETFNPDRFTPEQEAARHRYAYRHETATHRSAVGPDARGTAASPTRSIFRRSRRRPTANARLTATRALSSVPGEFWTCSLRRPGLAAGSYSEANGVTAGRRRRFRWRLCVSFAVGLVAISLAAATAAPADPGDDWDADGVADELDNCPDSFNPAQQDADANGRGDACDPADTDYDGWNDSVDNCPSDYNPGQEDGDGDGRADACYPPITSALAPYARFIPGRTNPAMSFREARRYLRLIIRARTHRSPGQLRRRCARLSPRFYRCRVRWRTGTYRYYGRVILLHIPYEGQVYWAYDFRGSRARQSCLRHTSPGRCGRPIHWR